MRNSEVAAVLYEVADLLELKGVPFKPNAYRRAARSVETLKQELMEYRKSHNLRDIPGVGEAIAKKIEELLDTGKLRYLEELREELPPGLLQIMRVPDIGPKTAMTLYRELRISSLEELKQAAESHRIRELKGFGPKSEERILQGLLLMRRRSGRMLLGYAYPMAERIREHITSTAGTRLVSLGGSLRRMKETIGDIDLLAATDQPDKVMDAFASFPEVEEVVERGPTKSVVRLKDGTQVDLRVVKEREFGAALQYFTGSKEHNVALRSLAIDKGMKLNEYGLFSKGGELVASEREEDIYRALGLEIMAPELRENRGEIEAAMYGRLPRIIELREIKGDFHVHSLASDGSASIEEIAYACKRKGYEYVGITDHSQSLKVANGLSVERLRSNIDVAHNVSQRVEGVKILIGAEVDILENGDPDYPEDVMKELDYVIGAVHSRFKMGEREMTERVVRALSSGWMDILAHPTGRLLEQREPYAIDMEKVLDAAKENEVCLELNADPNRLDLSDLNCMKARERGVMIAIGTDAHSLSQLDNMVYGVATARRGWLESKHLLNSLGVQDLVEIFSK
ncbi:MAG: DNA polymerase/3'-5' exonuclease PolX [Methanomassiliicoccales archaeon]